MENIDVNWKITNTYQNIITVEYSHQGVQPVTVSIALYGNDVNNVAAIIQAKAPYQYFYNALNPAAIVDVAGLAGQTGTATLTPPTP